MSYETVPSLEELERLHYLEVLENAVALSLDAANSVFGIFSSTEYSIQVVNDEASAGFPARLAHDRRRAGFFGKTNILANVGHLTEYFGFEDSFYPNSHTDQPTLFSAVPLYIAGSIIPHTIVCSIPSSDTERLRTLTSYMYDRERLDQLIADDLAELGEENVRFLRLVIETRTPDQIAEINRLRLAFGVLRYQSEMQSVTGQPLNPVEDMVNYYKEEFTSLGAYAEEYVKLAGAWGCDEDMAMSILLEEASLAPVAMAYPMTTQDIMEMAKVVNG